nr:hypothetical protein [Rhodoplanes roseus]
MARSASESSEWTAAVRISPTRIASRSGRPAASSVIPLLRVDVGNGLIEGGQQFGDRGDNAIRGWRGIFRPTGDARVSQAFRRAVRFDLYKARDAFFATHGDANGNATCAVTGERITRDDAHMDHCPPMTFEVIVTTFLCGRGLSLESVTLTTGQDNQVSPEVTDQTLSEALRSYHSSVARLDLVRNTVNLAQAGRHHLKDGRISLVKVDVI